MTKTPSIYLALCCLFAAQTICAADVSGTQPAAPQAGIAVTQPASIVAPPSATLSSDAAPTPLVSDAEASADLPLAIIQEANVTDLWQRLRTGMSLAEMDSPLVRNNEQWFANRPAYLSTTLDRARLYLFHIVEAVDKRHMPMEIALLPIIESAYNPQALSRSNAAGIWQFIPSTGKVFGLKQNSWYDGRRDIVNATQAALDYLQRLHGMFNDWELALAAYNCGEGCVSRAIAKNRARGLGTNFSSLDLPPETRNYVPRLLAIRNVIREPERFGVALNDVPNAPAFDKVTLSYPIEAKTAANLAGMTLDDFLAFNPGFRRRVIYAESQNTLLLPPENANRFNASLAATESAKIRLHTIQAPKGALLSKIADRFDVTVQWLKDHNPLEVKRNKLARAQTLILPAPRLASKAAPAAKPIIVAVAETAAAHTSVARHTPYLKAKQAKVRVHTIRKGDTLYSLAKHYRVKLAAIVELNGTLKKLHPGEKIHIPADS
ncbi:MAG: hypothetical protein AUJ86_05620 [Hydrogenophilaceae bacterium CG1_02_62_390]|nr:MAG: hypothetical protein AUJ86_05620 [Hydrogenophilaceae bacterium CG1_02_62_390]